MKNRLSRIIMSSLLLLVVGVSGLLAGCAPGASTTSPTTSTPKTRTITDVAGRVVELPYNVTRIADQWPANIGMVLMLGGADKLVGISQQAQNQPWLRKLYPKIMDVPTIISGQSGGDLNIETLISIHPDVLLVSYSGTMPAFMDRLAAANIPVVLMPNTTFDDIKTTMRLTGQVIGPDSAAIAEEWIKYYDNNVKKIAAVTATIPEAQRVRVLHTLRPTILTVDGVGGLVNEWIKNSGGVNVAVDIKGNSGTATMEQIIKWNPDVIICGTEPNTQNAQTILTDPAWSGIKAVKDKKVYVNPTGVYLWDRHSGEGAMQILWAAKLLYPDKFKDVDIKAETKAFYAKFFRYDVTDSDFDSLMNATAPQ